MHHSNSKKIGFVGTLLFHVFLFFICFISSIGYTSTELPTTVEITYLSYKDSFIDEEVVSENHHNNLSPDKTEDKQVVEDIITEDTELVTLPNDEDTINISEIEEVAELPSISLELEKALSKINKSKLSKNSSKELDDNVQNSIESDFNDLSNEKHTDGYSLSDNRFAVKKVKPDYSCKETGTVVVRVWVNRDGITIKAEAGVRGTTESSSCLLKEAKIAALQTTWTPYLEAPEIQIGQITYNFYHN